MKQAMVPNTVGSPYPPLPPSLPGSDAVEPEHFQYSLSTLMLAMTLIALLIGLCVSFPGLGIPLTILAIPAWVRTSHALNIEPPDFGSKTSLRNKLDKFVVSMAAMTFVAIAMGIGFFVTCGSVGLVGVVALNNYQSGMAMIMSLLSGFAGGSLAALWMLRITWPKRRPPMARQDFHV
jgi:hypothetical protein